MVVQAILLRCVLCLCLMLSCLSSAMAGGLYAGRLYDAHAHLTKWESPADALNDYANSGFDRAVLFADIWMVDAFQSLDKSFFVLLSDPFLRKKVRQDGWVKEVSYTFQSDRLARIEAGMEVGKVYGFGEIYVRLGWAPFAPDGISTDIQSDGIKRLMRSAEQHDVTVHIHLDSEHVATLKTLLETYPKVRVVLAHCGFFQPDALADLFKAYPNLYAETSLIFNPFIDKFANLPLADGKLKPDWQRLLTAHADRILIGTDYAAWRSQQLPKLATYYRQVLGLLPPDAARKIAYENFQRVIEPR